MYIVLSSKGIRHLYVVQQGLNLLDVYFVVTSSNYLRILNHFWSIDWNVLPLRILSLALDLNVLHVAKVCLVTVSK